MADLWRKPQQLPKKSQKPNMTFDKRTEGNIATLLPKAQEKARSFMSAILPVLGEKGCTAKIISGTRSYDEQDALYAKGRTSSGPKVTNARGGYSWHNWGCAFDIGIFRGEKYLEESPIYREIAPIGEGVGLEWGGRWKFQDEPHYQLRPPAVKGMSDSNAFSVLRAKLARNEDLFS